MPVTPLPEREAARDLWFNGLSAPEISLQLGVKAMTIHKWVARYRWKRSAAAIKTAISDPQVTPPQDIAKRITILAVEQAERLMNVIRDSNVKTLSDSKTASSALAASYATARKALGLDDNANVSTHLHYHVMRDCRSSFAAGAVVDVAATTEPAVASAAEPAAEQNAAPSAPSPAPSTSPDDTAQPPPTADP